MPLLRWPGGNFVSGYHWPDGVGPRDERPRRIELAWHAEESNRFGTDEFIAYCRELGAEPYICVNMGTGTMDEAQAWVEYCNGTGNTHWANLRRAATATRSRTASGTGASATRCTGAGRSAPRRPTTTSRRRAQFAKVMKQTDPSIELDQLRPERLERVGPDR